MDVRTPPDFDRAPERVEPCCEPVDGHALHAAAKNLGKRRLVSEAEIRGLLLSEFAPFDRFPDNGDERALGCEFGSFGRRKADVFEHASTALVKSFSHFFIPPRPICVHISSDL